MFKGECEIEDDSDEDRLHYHIHIIAPNVKRCCSNEILESSDGKHLFYTIFLNDYMQNVRLSSIKNKVSKSVGKNMNITMREFISMLAYLIKKDKESDELYAKEWINDIRNKSNLELVKLIKVCHERNLLRYDVDSIFERYIDGIS